MKQLIVVVLLAGLLCPVLNAAEEKFKSDEEAFAYSIGVQFGTQLKSAPFKIDVDAITRGLADAMKDKALITPEEAQKIQRDFFMSWQKKEGKTNKDKGEVFLDENKKKDGVQVTKSGLQYKVVKAGKGPKPKMGDKVTVHYKGTLIDGKEFDSSYKRGKPMEFEVGRVIPGWNEGLQLMPIGSKYQFWIPGDLGYGERGAGGDIGPNAVLIFEVELLEIK